MTDIVERLRRRAIALDWATVPTYELQQAADEIERLRGRIDALREAPDIKTDRANERTEIWHKHAMNCDTKRLREALEATYEYIDHATGALPIIRAALSQKEGE